MPSCREVDALGQRLPADCLCESSRQFHYLARRGRGASAGGERPTERSSSRASEAHDRSGEPAAQRFAELCDTILLDYLERHQLPNPEAELHTETPGLIIDRLSILSLKLFHTAEEVYRLDAPPGHAERNRERHHILIEQSRRPGEGARPALAASACRRTPLQTLPAT